MKPDPSKEIKKKTTLKRFLIKRTLYYVLPNMIFNFIVAYASFRELGYTHFFAGTQNLARLTLPMAIFLPVILTIDIIKRVTVAAEEGSIEFMIDDNLNTKRLMTKLSILHGVVSGLLVLSMLFLAQYNLSEYYKLDATAMAILVGVLAGLLSVLSVYLPVRHLRKYFYKPISTTESIH
ncbi:MULTISPECIES: hypothetical protein [Chryseobacterium]|uniref:hypothetical protein n=1 Tax=Chryseobacterium TaxID=59732 RepID=UPI001BE768F7|nr:MULTISPECIES: hypothetical protein [Chryseobacterium]MBT2622462.1 hypothetical protein [Chryseobacterium sp. ISL-6]